MQVTLMFNNSDTNVIGKSLTTIQIMDCTIKHPSSIINPILTIKGSDDIAISNYIYIPNWNRYYFVTDVRSLRNGLWEFKCHVDVLESYKSQIKAITCLIARSESNGNLTIDDGYVTSSIPLQSTKLWPNSFTSQYSSFALTVLGEPGNKVTSTASEEITDE